MNISRACLTSMHKTNAAVVIDTKRWVIQTNLASFKAHIAFVIHSNDFRHYLHWTLYNALSSLADDNKQIFVDVVLFIVLPVQTGKVFASLGPSVGFIVQIVLLIAIVFRERALWIRPLPTLPPSFDGLRGLRTACWLQRCASCLMLLLLLQLLAVAFTNLSQQRTSHDATRFWKFYINWIQRDWQWESSPSYRLMKACDSGPS